MEKSGEKRAQESSQTAWDDLGAVEFTGKRTEPGGEAIVKGQENLTEPDFLENQPEERQQQMKREWVGLELARIDVHQADSPAKLAEARSKLKRMTRTVVNEHLHEADAIDYLAEVMSESVEQVGGEILKYAGPKALMERENDLAEKGVDAEHLVDTCLDKWGKEGELSQVLDFAQDYRDYSFNVDKYVLDVVGRGETKQAWLNLGRIKRLGVTAAKLNDLQKFQRERKSPGINANEVMQANLPQEVVEEQQRMAERLPEQENVERMYAVLGSFTSKRWEKCNRADKMFMIEKLAEAAAEDFGVDMPISVELVNQDEYDDTMTYGRQEDRWVMSDDPRAEDFVKKLHEVGIETSWVRGSRITLSVDHLDNGAEVAETVTHELHHAWQSQMDFLWQMGYFDRPDEKKIFPQLPELAKYYAANKESDNYHRADWDYDAYRGQMLEDEAFLIGQRYGDAVRGIEEQESEEA